MEIFKLFGSILVDSSEAQNSISKAGKEAEGLGSKLGAGIQTAAKWAMGIGAAAVGVGAALLGVADSAAKQADEIDKMSQKIGISKTGYQEWNYAMNQCGIDISIMQTGVKKLTDLMDDANNGNKTAIETFDKLGVSITDSSGALKSQEEMMNETLYALAAMPDSTERAALAADLFGKSATELEPLLNAGVEGIDALTQRAHELGLVMSDDAVNAGVTFGDTLDDVKKSLSMVGTGIGLEIMPIIQKLLDWVIANMPAIQETTGKVFAFIGDAIKVVVDVIKWLVSQAQEQGTFFNTIWETVKKVFSGIMDAIQAVFKIFAALFKGDWEGVWNGIKDFFSSIWDTLKGIVEGALKAAVSVITGFGKAIYEAGKNLFSNLWDGIKGVWTSISNWVSEKINWLKDKLTFWKSSKDKISEADNDMVDGSHAAGLPFVPYDGYRAELHRGETITSADGNAALVESIVKSVAAIMGSSQQGKSVYEFVVKLNDKVLARELYDPFKRESAIRGDSSFQEVQASW